MKSLPLVTVVFVAAVIPQLAVDPSIPAWLRALLAAVGSGLIAVKALYTEKPSGNQTRDDQ